MTHLLEHLDNQGKALHRLESEKAEFTLQPENLLPIIKLSATHKDFASAFKTGYIKGFKLLWLELYNMPEQQLRVVVNFPSRDIETIRLED